MSAPAQPLALDELEELDDQRPSPHTPLPLRLRRGVGSGLRRVALAGGRGLLRLPLTLSMWIAGRLVSRPLSWICFASALVLATPVTVRDVAAVLMILVATLVAYPERRTRLSSLQGLRAFAKRRRRIRRRWATVCEDSGLAKSGDRPRAKRVPRLRKVTATPVGVRIFAEGGNVSISAGHVGKAADRVKAGFRARDLKVREHGGPSNRLLFDLIFDDPFETIIRPEFLPAPTKPLHVVTGLDGDGEGLQRDMRLPTLLVGGKGAGKSSEVWAILWGLQTAGIYHRVRVFDPKGGQEFVDLDEAAYYYERNPTLWGQFLQRAWTALAYRQDELRKAKMRKNDFTADRPLDVMIIDELLTVLAFSDNKKKIQVKGSSVPLADAFMIYLSECRSAGFTVIACSQLTQKATIGDIRDLFDYVTCLRVASDDMVRSVLGDPKLHPAHEIPALPGFEGIGYTQTEAGVVKYRAAYLDDDERTDVARRMRQQTAWIRARQAAHKQTEDVE